MADIDTISIYLTQNIGNSDIDIDILYCSALWPTHIASKVVNDVNVIPYLPFRTSRDVTRCNDVLRYQIRYSTLLI